MTHSPKLISKRKKKKKQREKRTREEVELVVHAEREREIGRDRALRRRLWSSPIGLI